MIRPKNLGRYALSGALGLHLISGCDFYRVASLRQRARAPVEFSVAKRS